MDVRSLRLVQALATAGNYGRAAQALHLSQPALSRGIARIEAMLGVQLFDRNRRGVVPTRFGELLVDRGRAVMAGLADIEREIALMRGLEVGEVSVAAGLYPTEISVGTAIGQLSAAHPGLRISLRAATWREVTNAAASGMVDVAVVESSPLAGQGQLAIEPLPRHEGVFVCRAGHPLLGAARLDAGKVFAYPFVGPRLPPRLAGPLRSVAPALRVDPVSGDVVPPLHIESITLAKRIVASGSAVAALPRLLVAAEIADGTLAALPWRPAWLHTSYGIVYRRDRTLSPAARAFIAEVRRVEDALAAAEVVPVAPPSRRRAPARSR